jgi:hypothetical protein
MHDKAANRRMSLNQKMWQFHGESVCALVTKLVESTNITDFSVSRFDGSSLLLIGSSDLSYYHEAEVLFTDVFYIQLYTPCLWSPRLRYAKAEEVAQFPHLEIDQGERLFAISSYSHEPRPIYFIGARDVEGRSMVFHYHREDLQPGEEIWDRVKET